MVEINVYADNLPPHSYYQLGDLNLPVLETLDRLLPGNMGGFFDRSTARLYIPLPGCWGNEKYGDIKLLELMINGYFKDKEQIKAHRKAKKYRSQRETLRYEALLEINPNVVDTNNNLVLNKGDNPVNSVLAERLSFKWDPQQMCRWDFHFPAQGGYKVPRDLDGVLSLIFSGYVDMGGRLAQRKILLEDKLRVLTQEDIGLTRDGLIEEIIINLLQFPQECLGVQTQGVEGMR